MEKRRKFERINKYFAVNIVTLASKGKVLRFDGIKANPKFYNESGLDFSPEGIRIMCSKPLPEESKIEMKMLMPDRDNLYRIKANGTIKWFKQIEGKYKKYFIIGIKFEELSKTDRTKLLNLWERST